MKDTRLSGSARIPRFDLGLVVQNHVQQGIVDLEFSVVFDKTQFSEFVHEKAHARSRRADHLRQCFLTKLSHDRHRPAFLAEICKQKEKPGEALFARIEQFKSSSIRLFRVNRYDMNSSENSGSLWMVAIMVAFSKRVITHSSTALVVAMRSGWPFRHPSPKKWPGPRIATTASLPCSETTVSLTSPCWM